MVDVIRYGDARATTGPKTQGRLYAGLRNVVRAGLKNRPAIKSHLVQAETSLGLLQNTAAQLNPKFIRANPRRLTIAVTAHCNLRCVGCRYGRDFMPGHQLPFDKVKELLSDAKEAGVELVRLYGGEPLLHPSLPDMVKYAVGLGLSVYVTTNGILLKQKIDRLFDAGLRNITVGYYGSGEAYNRYVQRNNDMYRHLDEGIATVRQRYGDKISLQLNYLIMRPTCNLEALHSAWKFAQRYDMTIHTDLIHYSLPYFSEGPDQELQFGETDRPAIEKLVAELIRLKQSHPTRIKDNLRSIRSIPDWLLKKSKMRVPCDANRLLWVGADGTVQLCYVTFRLGNLFEKRLRDMLFTDAHQKAAQDAFSLNCPNCHCERDSRIQKHIQSMYRYR